MSPQWIALSDKKKDAVLLLDETPARAPDSTLIGQFIHVTGRVRAVGDASLAPLSNRPAAVWSLEVRAKAGRAYDEDIVVKDASRNDVIVQTITGSVLVRSATQVLLTRPYRSSSATIDAPSGDEMRVLNRYQIDIGQGALNRSVKYTERILACGSTVSALGSLQRYDGPAADGIRWELVATPISPLIVTDASCSRHPGLDELRSVRLCDASMLSEGSLVRLQGVVQPGEQSVRAPLSGRPCVAYRLDVFDDNEPTDVVAREQRSTGFVLRTDHGDVVVSAGADTLRLVIDVVAGHGVRDSLTPAEIRILDAHRIAYSPAVADFVHRFRFFEGVIEAGERVDVVGLTTRQAPRVTVATAYRELPQELWRLVSADDTQIAITDRVADPLP